MLLLKWVTAFTRLKIVMTICYHFELFMCLVPEPFNIDDYANHDGLWSDSLNIVSSVIALIFLI